MLKSFILWVTFFASTLLASEQPATNLQFILVPSSIVKFSSSTGAVLNCLSEGVPTPTITWLTRDGRAFTSQPPLVDVDKNKSLIFHPFSPDRYRADVHSSTLRCSASNIHGTIISPPITIQAVVSQPFSVVAESVRGTIGGSANLKCGLPSHISTNVEIIVWETRWKTIYPSILPDGRYHMMSTDGSLLIQNIQEKDQSETYVCKVLDKLTNQIKESTPARITVVASESLVRPSIMNKKRTVIISEGSTVNIPCIATGSPLPTVQWSSYTMGSFSYPYNSYNPTRSSQTLMESALGSNVLVVKSENVTPGQSFTCTANNSLGIDQMSVEVKVDRSLKVEVTPAYLQVDLGASATFSCSVEGSKVTVTWYKDGMQVMATGRIVLTGHQLMVSSVSHEDAGMYQCMAQKNKEIKQATGQLVLGDSQPVFLYQFIEQTIQAGPPVALRCKASGNPLPVIKWTINGLSIPLNNRVIVRENPGNRGEVISEVNISNTEIQQGGTYRCTATNRAGQEYHEANLNIYGPPIARQVGPVNAVAGKTLKLHCPIAGYPLTRFTWSRDGVSVGANGLGRGVTGDGILVIEKVRRPQDAGVYTCRAANREGISATGSVQVAVLVGPSISPFPTYGSVVEGERKTLTCTVSKGDTPLTLTWLRNGVPLTLGHPISSHMSVMNLNSFNSVLSIEKVLEKHSAKYTCRATNLAATAELSFILKVNVPPRIQPFTFQDGLVEGFRTRVVCGVSQGDPPMTLTWFKDNRPLRLARLPATQVTVIDAYSSVLTITTLQPLHEGTYACEATNLADVVRIEATLSVNAAPTWILEPEDVTVIRGHSSLINCLARGSPRPSVKWKKKIDLNNNKTPSSDLGYRNIDLVQPKVTQLNNGSLYISRVELSHAGIYLCRVTNNVTHIDKAIRIRVNSAPYFVSSSRTVDTKAGETAFLECRVRGDPTPSVSWLHVDAQKRKDMRSRESTTIDPNKDLVSTFSVADITTADGGLYVCLARNEHGKNAQMITINVHEPPAAPKGLRVSEVTSRSSKIVWLEEGPKPTSYLLQYKLSSQVWDEATEMSLKVIAIQNGIEISPLLPSTNYDVRVIAINHLGRSLPSEVLRLKTGAEKPGAAPTGVQVEPLSATQVRVQWLPPPESQTNGEIIGYYVGYAPINSYNRQGSSLEHQYNFTTVHSSDYDDVKPTQTIIQNLIPYSEYSIVVQAFNSEGSGPRSSSKNTMTLEDAPNEPPVDVRCTSLSKNSVQIYWRPPANQAHNGIIRGYRIEYEEAKGIDDTVRHSQTTNQNIVLSSLTAATNYSIRVRSYTSAGEGPWSSISMCITDEDIPGRPGAIHGVVSGPGNFIVSWSAPKKRGGIITAYVITWRVVGSRIDAGRGRQGVTTVAGNINWVEIKGIMGSLVEVDVVASTRVGKGPPASSRVTLTSQIPGAIYSIGGQVIVHENKDILIPCGHVGDPVPRLEWKYRGQPILAMSRSNIESDGSLKINKAMRSDTGNYSCTATNQYGSDRVSYYLLVLVRPEAPLVTGTPLSTGSILVKWNKVDSGGTPITGFDLSFRKDNGLWTNLPLHRNTYSYQLKDLECGTKYHIYLISKNIVGSSAPSETTVVQTLGSVPNAPEQDKFIRVNKTEAVIYTRAWKPLGCPITYFSYEYKSSNQIHWVQVSSGDAQSRVVHITDLQPSTLYSLKATAVTSSGTLTHTYKFSTLNHAGEAPPMWHGMMRGQWLSARVLLPLLTSAVALASSLGLVCYCIKKKNFLSPRDRITLQDEDEKRKKARETKFNMAQREQYYATIRKLPHRDSQSDIPENAEDIYPYATFQMPEPSTEGEIPMYSLYHDRSKQKSEPYIKGVSNRRRHSRSRSRSSRGCRSIIGDSEDYETMGSDTETMLDDYETEHCVSSRTESSNQLEDLNSLREHNLIYTRTAASEEVGLSQGNPRITKGDPHPIEVKIMAGKKRQSGSSGGGESIYGGGPKRTAQQLQQQIHHNLLYHAESSSSPETTPTNERKSFPRRMKSRNNKGDPDYSLSSAVSTDSISTQLSKAFRKPNPNKPNPIKPKKSLPTVIQKPLPKQPTTFMSYIRGGAKRERNQPTNKRRSNSASSILSSKLSRDSLEISETECDREIVPPPRSYSDARYHQNLEHLATKKNEGCQQPQPHKQSQMKSKKSKDFSIAV